MELTKLTLLEARHSLLKGDTSSSELTRACLERIEQVEPDLHAFLHIASERALAQAGKSDRTIVKERKNGDRGNMLLTGIPIAVKDVLSVDGLPCTCGSKSLEGFIPPYTATAVRRLQEAGAIVIGKTNTDEFAMGSSTENSAYGVTRNPWDTERVPGGSSGGSAAAVTAHMVPVALGTDTGGSIRQPAAFCGITGLKPTYGRISRYGLVAYGSSLDCVGILGRSAEDLALLFMIMAGSDPLDPTSVERPVPATTLGKAREPVALKGLNIGAPKEFFRAGIQPEVETSIQKAIDVMRGLGAQVEEISLPHTEYALPVYYLIAPAEASANLARFDGVRYGPRISGKSPRDISCRTRGEGFGAEVKRRIMLGTYALSAGYYDAFYGQAQKVRTLIKQDFDQAFEQVHVIVAPVTPTTAFRIGAHRDDPLAMYLEDVFTLPANLAGVPGLAFPVGFDNQGLPIGMQLMGRHFQEDLLFKAAYAYQQVTTWHKQYPNL